MQLIPHHQQQMPHHQQQMMPYDQMWSPNPGEGGGGGGGGGMFDDISLVVLVMTSFMVLSILPFDCILSKVPFLQSNGHVQLAVKATILSAMVYFGHKAIRYYL